MDLGLYRCPDCHSSNWKTYSTLWQCQSCQAKYQCSNGIPRLYLEPKLGANDSYLRNYLYDGLLGRLYQIIMPFLTMPARPIQLSWPHWLVYMLFIAYLIFVAWLLAGLVSIRGGVGLFLAGATGLFLWQHKYLLALLIAAVPVRISLWLTKFRPEESFGAMHARLIQHFEGRDDRLRVLDIATGTCNSLYRHGWMKLNADYVGVDLSDVMLQQGMRFMAVQSVPVDFVLADAANLPLASNAFDIVLSYGAVNGLSDPSAAIREMLRVAKPGALILFLDEQLYEGASCIERFYFEKVLSSHNTIHKCPIECFPPEFHDVTVNQVYQFYYLCAGFKSTQTVISRDLADSVPASAAQAH